jgi:YspA, cpYpsA-related SLOG family
MIIIGTGGRNFTDRELVYSTLDEIHSGQRVDILIHGGCQLWDSIQRKYVNSGADWLCEDWCRLNGVPTKIIYGAPYFREHGKVGGRLRNKAMGEAAIKLRDSMREKLREWVEVQTVAFEGGSGTQNMIDESRKLGIKSLITWETKSDKQMKLW